MTGEEVILKCNTCGIEHSLGLVDLGGRTDAEKWGASIPLATKDGWGIRTAADGRRSAVCPGCLKSDPANKQLPAFSGGAACVKCNQLAPETAYARLGDVEYLMRKCTNCGYRWPESPADARKPWWKRLLRL